MTQQKSTTDILTQINPVQFVPGTFFASSQEMIHAQQQFLKQAQICSTSCYERHIKGLDQLVETLETVRNNSDVRAEAKAYQDYFEGLLGRFAEDARDGINVLLQGMNASVMTNGQWMTPWLSAASSRGSKNAASQKSTSTK